MLFALFVAAYAAILLLNPSYTQIDYEALRETIFTDGDHMPLAVFPEMGRFYPLFGMEYRLISLLSPRIIWLYVFICLQFLAMVWLMTRLMRQAGAGTVVTYLFTGALILLPGFTNVWVGFAATERNVMFLMATFLLCFMAYRQSQKTVYLVLGLVCANIALYYKEPVFVMLAAFAGTHLLITWRTVRAGERLYGALLLLGSFVFIAAYAVIIVPHLGKTLYGDVNPRTLLTFAKILYSYVANDPLVLLLIPILTVWRTWDVVFQGKPAHPLFDPMLFAGLAYLLVFLKLNIYATNYLLPAYVFALPAAYHFLVREQLLKLRVWRILAGATAVLVVLNAIPLGLHIMATQKYVPVNSILTMDALAADIKKRDAGQRPSIFLDGVYRELTLHKPAFTYDRDAYFNVGEAMKRRGLDPTRFDLKSDLPPKYAELFPKGGDPAYLYSVFNSDKVWKPEQGDYLVVTPSTTRHLTDAYLASLLQDYDLVYRTESSFAIPDLTLRTQIKRLIKDLVPAGIVFDANVQRTPDYYILVKK